MYVDERLQLKCDVGPVKTSDIKWYKDGEEIKTLKNRIKIQKQLYVHLIILLLWYINRCDHNIDDFMICRLKFKALQLKDAATYSCGIWDSNKKSVIEFKNVTLVFSSNKDSKVESSENLQDVLDGIHIDCDL